MIFLGCLAQPLVVPFLPSILEGVAHKKKEVQVAAEQAGNAIIDILCPWAIRVVQGMLFAGAQETKWQVCGNPKSARNPLGIISG